MKYTKQMNMMMCLSALGALAALPACKVKPADTFKNNVVVSNEANALRTYTRSSQSIYRMSNNKLFLWREDMTAQNVAQALGIGRTIDRLDDQAYPLNVQESALDSQLRPLNDLIDADKLRLREITRTLRTDQHSLDDLTAAAGATPTADQQAQIDQLNAAMAALQTEKAQKTQEQADTQAKADPLQAQLDVLNSQSLDIFNLGQVQVNNLMTIVDYYKTQPTSVMFQLNDDGTNRAEIRGWNLGDDMGDRNFTTEDGSIRDVTYTELGGVFRFTAYVFNDDAQTDVRETYTFEVARAKQGITDRDGRIFFQGDFTRELMHCDPATERCKRKGSAKLVSGQQ